MVSNPIALQTAAPYQSNIKYVELPPPLATLALTFATTAVHPDSSYWLPHIIGVVVNEETLSRFSLCL